MVQNMDAKVQKTDAQVQNMKANLGVLQLFYQYYAGGAVWFLLYPVFVFLRSQQTNQQGIWRGIIYQRQPQSGLDGKIKK
jgi:hypothetical protein